MNKTTEALKLAEEALVEYRDNQHIKAPRKTLAAIREALAEQDHFAASGKPIDHIAGGGKMVAEPVNTRSTSEYSEQVKQSIEEQGYVPLSDDAKFIFIDGFGEVPIDWDRYHGTTSAVQPVKQEPVGVVESSEEWGVAGVLIAGLQIGTKLYAAPVDAKAIREQALEEAAKWLKESGLIGSNDCAAAIRGLK